VFCDLAKSENTKVIEFSKSNKSHEWRFSSFVVKRGEKLIIQFGPRILNPENTSG
jgi:glutathione peroxidase-family protein